MSHSIDQSAAAPVWAAPAAEAQGEGGSTSVYPMAPAPAGEPPAAPAVGGKTSKVKAAIVGVVAALVIGGGGFAVIRAAGDSSGTTAATQPAGPGAQGGQGAPGGMEEEGAMGGPAGAGGFAGGVNGALYGDFVASDGNGGYTTRRLQSGTVTAVSDTSITAESADGHATTFVVGSGTTVDDGQGQLADVAAGDSVTIVGTVDEDTATATSIVETGQ